MSTYEQTCQSHQNPNKAVYHALTIPAQSVEWDSAKESIRAKGLVQVVS